jgi:hypothetical protein
MVRKKTEKSVAAEVPESVAAEVPESAAIKINLEPEGPKVFKIVLEGNKGQFLEGGVNGKLFKLPKGIEITVGEPIYNAVKAYIAQERD